MAQTALITGSAKRIGKAIALAMAEWGYDIAVHYRNSKLEAEEVVDAVQSIGRQAATFHCDLEDMAAVSTLIPQVHERFPNLDILVNNASLFKRAFLEDTDLSLFNQLMDVNFKTPFFLTQQFARVCQKGHIINLLDTKVTQNQSQYFLYSLTKKSLLEFTRMAAKALGPDIRVNGIAPGLILPSGLNSHEDFEKMGEFIPLKRTGDTDNIVKAVQYVMNNDFVTGEILFVDGGEHLK